MAYTTNPKMGRLRAKAVDMVRVEGKSVREVARYFGYTPGAVSKWCKKAPLGGAKEIPTLSSRPKSHPKQISTALEEKILLVRRKTNGRCAEVIHQTLLNEGFVVSLSTVKRTLDRAGVTRKRSVYKRRHVSVERPEVSKEGDLLQVDTIHIMQDEKKRIYVYTLLDVFSRFAYAYAVERISTRASTHFFKKAKRNTPFSFTCIQSDNGPEFSQNFTERIHTTHRHSRVRKPNDNAFIERFNRTIQEECLNKLPVDVNVYNKHLKQYLRYYNEERLHLGINLKTPLQIIS